MRLSDFEIFYLNLARRPERRQAIERQLARLGLLDQAHYVEAVDGQSLPQTPQLQERIRTFKTMARRPERILGRIGCLESHLAILRRAVRLKLDRILIIEDDCEFSPQLTSKWRFTPPQDAQLIYLGGLFWRQQPEAKPQTGKWVVINRQHLKLATTICYGIIGRENIKQIYDTVRQARPSAIDLLYINHIQNQGRCYVVNPVVCCQSDQYVSDVSNYGETTPTKPYRNSYTYLQNT
jgi:hypothetical protein